MAVSINSRAMKPKGVLRADLEVADYAELRLYAGAATTLFVTGSGIAGTFVRDATVTVDNGGTEIVGVHGWRRVFDGRCLLSWFIPSTFVSGTTAGTDYLHQAIQATPIGGTLVLDYAGVVMVDPPSTRYVSVAASPTNKKYAASIVDRAIKVHGTADCQIKVKPFCAAWAAMLSGDSVSVLLVTTSNVEVRGVRFHCNSNNHYETDGGGFKWWETGPAGKRPIDGVRIMPESDSAEPVVNSNVIECEFDQPLTGVVFEGNMLEADRTAFLARQQLTGIVRSCYSIRNKVRRNRGNAINFINGVASCASLFDESENGMYHTTRFYSDAVDCVVLEPRERVSCDDVVATWNETDLGYWRTNKSADAAFKVTRAGFAAGGEWNYIANVHNILDCSIIRPRGLFVPMTAGHSTYYNTTDFYMAGVSSVQAPPGLLVEDADVDGYLYGIGMFSSANTADRRNVTVRGGKFKNSTDRGGLFQNIPGLVLDGARFIDNNVSAGQHLRVRDCPYSYLGNLTFGNELKSGDRVACSLAGDLTGIKFGQFTYDESVPLANRFLKEAGATPDIAIPSISTAISGFVNGWTASTAFGGVAVMSNVCTGYDGGTVMLCLRLNSATRTATQVVTLPVGMRPVTDIGFVFTDAVTGNVYMARVMRTGVVEFLSSVPLTETALLANVVYSTGA
jgi:hypothetical protein